MFLKSDLPVQNSFKFIIDHKQKTPLMWGYSAMLETESVLSCLFLVWDNAAPKVMPVRLVLFLGNLKKIR